MKAKILLQPGNTVVIAQKLRVRLYTRMYSVYYTLLYFTINTYTLGHFDLCLTPITKKYTAMAGLEPASKRVKVGNS